MSDNIINMKHVLVVKWIYEPWISSEIKDFGKSQEP